MYTRFVWWLYEFWHGKSHSVEREDGDEEVYRRVLAQQQEQVEAWARFWRVS